MVACAKVIVFFWLFCFSFLLKNHYKNVFFYDFDMFIFSFFGQKSRVNNLATVRPITWPHFWQTFWKNAAKLLTLQFSRVFLLELFFKHLILPAERRIFFKKQETIKKVAKLLTYGGQVIHPTAYIYIYASVFACRGLFLEPLIFRHFLVKVSFCYCGGLGEFCSIHVPEKCIFPTCMCAN